MAFIEYHKSIAKELSATKDRIRQLIGDRHWQTDGEHKEAVLRRVLRNQLPESVRVGRGFACFRDNTSSQIDILVTAGDKPTLFRDGELALVTPDAIHSIVEVKTALHDRTSLREALNKVSNDIEHIRHQNPGCLAGLFIYDNSRHGIRDSIILEELRAAANEQQNRVSTAMVIIQSEVVAAKFIIHPCRQANYPVWRQLSPS
jgi:hypothetical protein